MAKTTTITWNARPVQIPAGTTLLDLLVSEGMNVTAYALDVNGRHVGRHRAGEVTLADGDEVWTFPVGGGG